MAQNAAASAAHLPSRFQPHPTNLYRIEERKEEQTMDCNIDGDIIKNGQNLDIREGSAGIVVHDTFGIGQGQAMYQQQQ